MFLLFLDHKKCNLDTRFVILFSLRCQQGRSSCKEGKWTGNFLAYFARGFSVPLSKTQFPVARSWGKLAGCPLSFRALGASPMDCPSINLNSITKFILPAWWLGPRTTMVRTKVPVSIIILCRNDCSPEEQNLDDKDCEGECERELSLVYTQYLCP